jgi:hypothetical protein
MALRLRRGTDAERLTITPLEGELIYTTDLKETWVGDGVTEGGNRISGITLQNISDLSDVDNTLPQIGQVLRWNGTQWEPSDDDTGIIVGADYQINIVGEDSSIIVDSVTNTFTGNFVGDGSQLTNLPGSNVQSIFDLNDVFRFESQTPDAGDVIIYDGENFVARKIRFIEGSDSTIILDANTNTFTGNFVGDGSQLTNLPEAILDSSGYRINILGDDSSIIIDTSNNSGVFNEITVLGERLNFLDDVSIESVNDKFSKTIRFVRYSPDGRFTDSIIANSQGFVNSGRIVNSYKGLASEPNLLDSGDAISVDASSSYKGIGSLEDTDNYILSTFIRTRIDPNGVQPSSTESPGRIDLYTLADGNVLNAKGISIDSQGRVSINRGDNEAQATLDVNGNGLFEGEVKASTFSGSYSLNNNSVVIDGETGSLFFAEVNIIGETGNTPATGAGDLANVDSWLQITVNGTIKFIPLYS